MKLVISTTTGIAGMAMLVCLLAVALAFYWHTGQSTSLTAAVDSQHRESAHHSVSDIKTPVSKTPVSKTPASKTTVSKATVSKTTAPKTSIPDTVDPNYPAPAKKLHRVYTDAKASLADQPELAQKIQRLDQQMEALNTQLQAAGITGASATPSATQAADGAEPPASADVIARLQAIRAHMAQREANP